MGHLLRLAAAPLAALALVPACGSDPCPTTIEAYCASQSSGCPTTWTAAQAPASWPCGEVVILAACQDVATATMGGFDVGTMFYYDPPSGALYRVESFSANFGGKQTCEAGSGSVTACDAAPHDVTGTQGCP